MMYSEIQEAVNFLASFLYGKIPRRKVCLFVEQLANFLILKYQKHWNPQDPIEGGSYRSLSINVEGKPEQLLSVASNSVGLELEEVTQHLPNELTIWINPGEVSYRVGQHGPITHQYDAQHNNTILNKLMAPGAADSRLKLNLNTPVGNNWLVNNANGNSSPVFELSTPNDYRFNVGTFAMTRFGSTKQKTDLNALKQIQRKAVLHGVNTSDQSVRANITNTYSMATNVSVQPPPIGCPPHLPRMIMQPNSYGANDK